MPARRRRGSRVGSAPQTMNRMTAFMRPWRRSGVIACRRLTCVTL
jgi:hypothetical protein